MKRKPMQVTVEAIFKAAGKLEAYNEAISTNCANGRVGISLDNDPYMTLAVEVMTGANGIAEVSVAHYFDFNGDAGRDPEIVFRADCWLPVELTMDKLGRFIRVEHGRYISSATGLANVWARNIREQGFIDVAKEQAQ